MQGPKKILIKSVSKAPSKIKIKKKAMTSDDVKRMKTQVLRFNNIIPLKTQFLDDFLEKTSTYLHNFETKSSNLIKIKSVRLYKDRFTPGS